MTEKRIIALAEHLGIAGTDEIEEIEEIDDEYYEYGNQAYLVLTEREADEKLKEYVEENLWAFKPEFLSSYLEIDVDYGVAEDAIKALQGKLYEDSNDFIRALVGKEFGRLCVDAEMSDGRGHFLSQYDGEEIEQGDYYIYRTN
jgi:hypothetical protein